MIKTVEKIDESIFNYLGADDYAVFVAVTGFCDEVACCENNVWIQYNEENEITAVVATGRYGQNLVFSSDDADADELNFLIGNNGGIRLDKKYLLKKCVLNPSPEKGVHKSLFWEIKTLNKKTVQTNGIVAMFKSIIHGMGKCEGALVTVDDMPVSGGFITFTQNISIISDIYTDERYRGKGYGKEVVEKLLNCSINENVYLISKEHNLGFYKKCGFEIVKEIYV